MVRRRTAETSKIVATAAQPLPPLAEAPRPMQRSTEGGGRPV
jgi:hypothetical protein